MIYLLLLTQLVLLGVSYCFYSHSERLLEECQMMRTARSAASQCPLQGKVVVKGERE